MTRKITIMVDDKVFKEIEKIQREQLMKGKKLSISKIANNWLLYFLGYDVEKWIKE